MPKKKPASSKKQSKPKENMPQVARKRKQNSTRAPAIYASEAGLKCYCGAQATCYDRGKRRDVCDSHSADPTPIRYAVKPEQENDERSELAAVVSQ